MSKRLFEEFEKSSSKIWKQKIQADLKGADYNETLIWKSLEGIDVKPFYHSDEYKGQFSSIKPNDNPWEIGQVILVNDDETIANKQVMDAFSRGAERIKLIINSESIDVNKLLKSIDFKDFKISINLKKSPWKTIQLIFDYLNLTGCDKKYWPEIIVDPIHHLIKTGNWHNNFKQDLNDLALFSKTYNRIDVDLSTYQNAGSTMAQQVAYGLSHINEYLNFFTSEHKDIDLSSLQVEFHVAVGSNYFFEIAKIRAIRKLWGILSESYNCQETCRISTTSSKRNKSIYDYNVNMLRTTTECMSSVLGGANTIYNQPYDSLYHKPNEFGDRIARNQLLILKNESYFDRPNNPADGAYYIESLTIQIAEKALEIFKSIERSGGFLSQLKSGTIQRKIKESALKEQEAFNKEEIVLLGVNKHPNEQDTMLNNLEITPFQEKDFRKVLIEPVIEKRLSETLEKKRLEKEKTIQ